MTRDEPPQLSRGTWGLGSYALGLPREGRPFSCPKRAARKFAAELGEEATTLTHRPVGHEGRLRTGAGATLAGVSSPSVRAVAPHARGRDPPPVPGCPAPGRGSPRTR